MSRSAPPPIFPRGPAITRERGRAAIDQLGVAHGTLLEAQAAKLQQDAELMGRIVPPSGEPVPLQPHAPAATIIHRQAGVAELRQRLREVHDPTWGTNQELLERLPGRETKAKLQRRNIGLKHVRLNEAKSPEVPGRIRRGCRVKIGSGLTNYPAICLQSRGVWHVFLGA